MSLTPHCQICGSSNNLARCAACKVTPYCSRDHQMIDRDNHATRCKTVKRARGHMEREQQKLRDSPGTFLMPANPFETAVGRFWGLLDTRDYMRARYGLVEALLKFKTFDAVKSAADHIRDMLRLCRSDNMGVRDLLPALWLRLGRDQDAYDFVKWYATTGNDSHYDWGDMDLPFLDVVNANVFESPKYLWGRWPDLSQLLCVALLKIKLLLDLKALQNSAFLAIKLPPELADRVRLFIPMSEIIWKDGNIMSNIHQRDRIEDLSHQIDTLFVAVTKANSHFWPALLKPGTHLKARPDTYSQGNVAEMQMKLQYYFDAWNETPGAIEFIKARIDKQRQLNIQTMGVKQENRTSIRV